MHRIKTVACDCATVLIDLLKPTKEGAQSQFLGELATFSGTQNPLLEFICVLFRLGIFFICPYVS